MDLSMALCILAARDSIICTGILVCGHQITEEGFFVQLSALLYLPDTTR